MGNLTGVLQYLREAALTQAEIDQRKAEARADLEKYVFNRPIGNESNAILSSVEDYATAYAAHFNTNPMHFGSQADYRSYKRGLDAKMNKAKIKLKELLSLVDSGNKSLLSVAEVNKFLESLKLERLQSVPNGRIKGMSDWLGNFKVEKDYGDPLLIKVQLHFENYERAKRETTIKALQDKYGAGRISFNQANDVLIKR